MIIDCVYSIVYTYMYLYRYIHTLPASIHSAHLIYSIHYVRGAKAARKVGRIILYLSLNV